MVYPGRRIHGKERWTFLAAKQQNSCRRKRSTPATSPLVGKKKENTMVCIKRPRSDTNVRGEYEVVSKAVTSKLHAQAERTNNLNWLLSSFGHFGLAPLVCVASRCFEYKLVSPSFSLFSLCIHWRLRQRPRPRVWCLSTVA